MRMRNWIDQLNPFRPVETVSAHCDLMCGVYNPAQARIEAESVHEIAKKYQDSDDETFRIRCIHIKEQRADPGQAPPVGPVDRLLQAAAPRGVPRAPRPVLEGHQGRR